MAELEKIQKNGSEQPVLFDKDDYYKTERSPFKRQALICLGVFMLNLAAGSTAGIAAVLIPQLTNDLGRNKFTTELESWRLSLVWPCSSVT